MHLSSQKIEKLNYYTATFTNEILTTEYGLSDSAVYVDFTPIFLVSSEFVMVINDNINHKIISMKGIRSTHCYDMLCHSEKLKSFLRSVLSDFIVDHRLRIETDESQILGRFAVLMSYKSFGAS
ncbi:hypothetical protein HNW13_017700 [Shewanella sp. BF02_Schw]|uniref:hypothetical protein n=1 Tax=Shewanella sp. BF02_Schw TaxID=394908 RepID=UPI001785A4E6|nr:hypothetical protein [Shewanella sp. BF02_Schw]MBO1897574.1 hypothetical protein [Shewanella sp. BF02_Schw]